MHNLRAIPGQKQNLKSRAKIRALYKDPHLRSSPILGEGKMERGKCRRGKAELVMEYMLLIYHNEEEAYARPEAEKQQIFQEFGAFTQSVVKSGHRKAGGPLEFTKTAATVRVKRESLGSTRPISGSSRTLASSSSES